MDHKTRGLVGGRRSRQPSLHPGPAHVEGRGLRGGLAVGSTVFAPKRRRTGAPQYAVGEVTGLQACGGTATVTFANTEPGVDDEAIPLYALIPCPSVVLEAANDVPLSKFVPRSKGPSCDMDLGEEVDDGVFFFDQAQPETPPQIPLFPSTSALSEEPEQEDSRGVLNVTHSPPESIDVFYARAFKAVCRSVLRLQGDVAHTLSSQVIFCVFDSYNTLHRFNVYMAFRGHRLYLIDGVSTQAKTAGISEDVNWLCLLAEDLEDNSTTVNLLDDWMPLVCRNREGGGRDALETVSVVRFNEDLGDKVNDEQIRNGTQSNVGENADIDPAVGRLLCVLGDVGNLITCRLSRGTKGDEIMATSLASPSRPRIPSGGHQRQDEKRNLVKPLWSQETTVELCVPVSKWELELIRLLMTRVKQDERNGVENQGHLSRENGKESLFGYATLPPQLLQSIACGNVFDASLSMALASSPGGWKLLDAVKSRVLRNGSFFGEDAFPVLAVARAILKDVLPTLPQSEHPLRQQRVALILPGTSGVDDGAVAYLHAVQRFLHSWHLFILKTDNQQRRQPSAAALLDSLAWLESGGVLLLNPEDPFCRLSLLQEEADIVITCGKAVLNSFPGCWCNIPHFAIHSEVELVEGPAHQLTLWKGATKEAEITDAEQIILDTAVAVGGEGAAPVMATAAALLKRLGQPPAKKKESVGIIEKQRQSRSRGADCQWTHLRQLTRAIALCGCRTPVVFSDKVSY